MTHTAPSDVNSFRIRVAGHLDRHWSPRLGGHDLTHHTDGTTTISAEHLDQAQLHGTLAAIRDIGARLLAVLPTEDATDVHHEPTLSRPLTTDRLTLRAATPADAATTWRYRRLPEVNRWLDGPLPGFEAYHRHFTDPGRLSATVVVQRRATTRQQLGTVIGDFLLRLSDSWAHREVADRAHHAQAELGWVLDPAHRGHGYATEAVRALLHHCFTGLDVHRVTAECFWENEASWRLMERVGMRREALHRRDALHRSGRWLDSVTYAALADEWQPGSWRRPPTALTTNPKEQP